MLFGELPCACDQGAGARLDGPEAPREGNASIAARKRISGRDNAEFKRFLAVKTRKNRDLVLVEGPKLLAEAVRSRVELKVVAVDGTSVSENLVPDGIAAVQFSSALMGSLSDVETHQGVIALAARPVFSKEWLEDSKAFVLILDGIQDPGNLGTLIRSAEAFGVSGVILSRGCADPFSPKALRASAGSAFRVPHVAHLGVDAVLELLPSRVRLVAAIAGTEPLSVFDAPLGLPLALALGSEGSGLSPRLEAEASVRIRIPQARPVESLNVASAGAIALFEIARRAAILSS